jgi:excinuclease UvrABC nuclease subunit
MISVKWDKTHYLESIEPPSGWVFFSFCREKQPLWCGYTPNLAQRLKRLRVQIENDSVFAEMSRQADTLRFEALPSAMDALIRYKVFLMQKHPEYQQALTSGREYVYLSLDAWRFPFIAVQSHTNDDWTYIGPWRNRFLLTDVLDSVARLLRLPSCDTGDYPCEKMDAGVCSGWCLALGKSGRSEQTPSLEKLDSLLKEAFLHPNNGLIELLEQEKNKYFNDLEFEKADLLDGEIENLAAYKDWLNFLYVSKTLAFKTETFSVEKGLLASCVYDGVEYKFPILHTEFRENETLALNLTDTEEARIIYEYHVKHHKG